MGPLLDIIIGFPGESEEDLLETISLVEEVQFDSAFTYSSKANSFSLNGEEI